jgi:hypothetical protein
MGVWDSHSWPPAQQNSPIAVEECRDLFQDAYGVK